MQQALGAGRPPRKHPTGRHGSVPRRFIRFHSAAADGGQQQQPQGVPTLMGGVLSEENIPWRPDLMLRSALQAKAELRGMSAEQLDAKMQELLVLMPGISSRLLALQADLLIELCSDTATVAARMVELKMLFPSADVSALVDKWPGCLTSQRWPAVLVAAAKLRLVVEDQHALDQLVERQPYLLCMDIDDLLTQMNRLFPGACAGTMLVKDPDLLTSLSSNRTLSLW